MMGKKVCQSVTRPALARCHKDPLGPYLYESEAAIKIIDQTTTVNGCRMHREALRLGVGRLRLSTEVGNLAGAHFGYFGLS